MFLFNFLKAFTLALCSISMLILAPVACAQRYSSAQYPQQHAGPTRSYGTPTPAGDRVTRSLSKHYVPRHLRQAGYQEPAENGMPMPDPANGNESTMESIEGAPMMEEYIEGQPVVGAPVEDTIGGCDSCGSPSCAGDCGPVWGGGPINDCRDCTLDEDCWIGGLGGLLYNGEYFIGVQGFTTPGSIRLPDQSVNERQSNFGLYSGFNFGIPFRRLTCGLVSGQFGVRAVQSNFDGSPVSSDHRNQTFITAGLYRRVDHGLQFGAVADVLHDDWFSELDVVQIRSDLSWAWPSGHQFGFRFSEGVQDNNDLGVIGDVVREVNGRAHDTYRFYYLHACPWGGYNQFYAGWSDESHTVLGMDYDLPLNNKWALQSGFTYLVPEEETVNGFGNTDEAWNITVGVVWRPRGRNWYKFYHRPLLPVADNGSMVIRQTN